MCTCTCYSAHVRPSVWWKGQCLYSVNSKYDFMRNFFRNFQCSRVMYILLKYMQKKNEYVDVRFLIVVLRSEHTYTRILI